jgi:predicted adenylyl cyclase CyaB
MYERVDTDRPHQLKAVLEAGYGIRSTVRKTRHLYNVGRTRIHIDAVESLGDFLELEVVLTDSEAPSVGEHEVRELMQKLGIAETQLVKGGTLIYYNNSTRRGTNNGAQIHPTPCQG